MSNITGTYPAGIKPKGFEALTVDDTAGGLALTVPKGAIRARIIVEDQPIRWRDDEVAPTALVGHLTLGATEIELHGRDSLLAFRAIKDGATDSELGITYYGE